MPNYKQSGSKKFIKTAAVVLVVAALAAGTYYYLHRNDNTSTDTPAGTTNLNPPSQAEKNDTKQHEQAAQNAANSSSSTSTQSAASKKQVTPIITTWSKFDAQNFGVNGFVQDVVEDNGTCTLKMTRQGKTVTETKKSFANVNNTTCGVIEVPYTSVPKGTTWQATLSYSSSTATGTSSTVTIEVQ